ncbi:hypothetical protein JXA34_03760 [Patescibacteria group bacterium]|nr:hypothetical protein [Patescibacteria group bacterium]
MTKIELELYDDTISTINKIRNINDSGIELIVPDGSVLFDNIINLKLINSFCDKNDVSVHFTTTDEQGNTLIEMMEEKVGTSVLEDSDSIDEVATFEGSAAETKPRKKRKFPKLKFNLLFLVIPLVIAIIGYFGLKMLSKKPEAYAKIFVNAQPLTRSITVKVSSTSDTNIENKILKGISVETKIKNEKSIETTGEKIEGEKARGTVLIYNKTTDEIELDKGAELAYKEDDEDLVFVTLDDIKIPPLAPQDITDPGSPLIPGQKEVDVEAKHIGDAYNIEKGSALELDDYKKSKAAAEANSDFKGGKSTTIKTVGKDDIEKLSLELLEEAEEKAAKSLKNTVNTGFQYIEGSYSTTITNEKYSHELGEETKELTLTQEITATGLSYSKKDLDSFLDKIVADIVPEGFELYEGDRDTKVDILGNSTNSILSPTEADVQVTLKTYIVPKLNKEDIIESLKGKTPEEAQKTLGGINNIQTYELEIRPSIPFFGYVPHETDKIHLEIVRE